jgi:hypothetical protein
VARQEAFHEWVVSHLGVRVPQKVDYRKYTSREDMGARTGTYNTNGYAEPATFTIHTLWTRDNHETVHIYTAFVAFLIERLGLPRVLEFFRTSTRDDSLDVIGQRFAATFGVTLDEAEAAWLASVG